MRLLLFLISVAIFCLGGCQKDPPTLGEQICKPENKPTITDSSVNSSLKQILGSWKLMNTSNFGNQAFLKFSVAKRATKKDRKDSLLLKFRRQDNEIFVSGLVNDCKGDYWLSSKNAKNWLYIKELGCTLLPGSGQYAKWEERYFKAIDNTTCYKAEKNRLILQYFINEDKAGQLMYKKVWVSSLFLITYGCQQDTSLVPKDQVPECIQQKITKQQNNCLKKVIRYHYRKKVVYLFSRKKCPDAYHPLYDKNCEKVCVPFGGMSGKGNGECPEFEQNATKKELIWSR